MATRKRGPIKIDLTGLDGQAKIDAQFNPLMNKYMVRIKSKDYYWSATEFAEYFRKWLVRQKAG